jgi:cell division control protein 24
MREFDKLRETGGSSEMQQMVESPTNLTAFLLKPFQRLAKYPLLLRVSPPSGHLATGTNRFVGTSRQR